MMEEPFGFSFIFSIFPVLFITVFVIVVGMFIAVAVRGTKEWHQNNQSPVLTVSAVIITKRPPKRRLHLLLRHLRGRKR